MRILLVYLATPCVPARRDGPYNTNLTEKHHPQRELNFWNYHHENVQIHLPEAATLSTGHHASLRVGLVPVEPLLRPWLAQTAKSASKLLNMTPTKCSGSHLATTQQRKTR